MTPTVWIGVASLAGAALFFAAGAALSALRHAARAPALAVAPPMPAREPEPVRPPPVELAELAKLREDARARTAELERLRGELATARAAPPPPPPPPEAKVAPGPEAIAMRERMATLQRELESSRQDAIAATRELELVEGRLRDVERELADKTRSARDLSTENEQLKGRLRDAEALRAEYVRLRTSVTEAEFHKREVARLEKELRALRADALEVPSPRQPARAAVHAARPPLRADRAPTPPPAGSISASLTHVLDRLSDAGTRSLAIGDMQGFPLASSGADGVALAAYAALLIESATRADDFLPVATPASIEVRDARGACVSVWAFDIETERLLLANLAVRPAEAARVDAALAELTSILAPSRAASQGAG